MKSTTNDMWQMVWETECNKIVMFAEKDVDEKVNITHTIHSISFTDDIL